MTGKVLLDTGPLIALIDRRDHYHSWATQQTAGLMPPLLTCEAVLTEACYLLRNLHEGVQGVLEIVRRGLLTISFRLEDEVARVAKLLGRYADVPMSLADACLVRISEQYAESAVITLDGDFRIYRKNGRQIIPTIMPDDRISS